MTRPRPKPSPSDDTVVVGNQSWENLWSAALKNCIPKSKPDGPGWKTLAELAVEKGVTRTTMDYHCKRLVALGRLEQVTGRAGPTRVVTLFFRPITPKSQNQKKSVLQNADNQRRAT